MTTAALPPQFNILSPAFPEDPYPAYASLRQAGPLCRCGPGTWGVTRYAEVSALLRDPRLGHGRPGGMRPPRLPARQGDLGARLLAATRPNAELPNLLSALDPPQHPRLRGLMSRVLNPPLVRRMRTVIRQTTDELVTSALDRAETEIVSDLALPLQLRVVCDLLGIPAADSAQVASVAADLGRAIILIPFTNAEQGNGEREASWLKAYLRDLMRERAKTPGDDVISRAIAPQPDGDRFTEDELLDNLTFLLFAGFETTMHLIAGGCLALAQHPDQRARLAADPSLVAAAAEEVLRYDAPLQWVTRVTTQPVGIGERVLRPGRIVLLMLGSANRDASQFREPDRLDLTRRPNPHLSFGGGAHHCLGVLLARAQGAAVFEQLISRCGSIDVAGQPVRRPHQVVRGYARVPLALRPRSAGIAGA